VGQESDRLQTSQSEEIARHGGVVKKPRRKKEKKGKAKNHRNETSGRTAGKNNVIGSDENKEKL